MAKIIITRIDLFIIHVHHILLHTDLFHRSKNQIMQLVSLFCKTFSRNHSMLLPYKMAASEAFQVVSPDHYLRSQIVYKQSGYSWQLLRMMTFSEA